MGMVTARAGQSKAFFMGEKQIPSTRNNIKMTTSLSFLTVVLKAMFTEGLIVDHHRIPSGF